METIPIEDAVELLKSEGYSIPSYPKGIALEVPDTFTPKELYERVLEAKREYIVSKYRFDIPEGFRLRRYIGTEVHEGDLFFYRKNRKVYEYHIGEGIGYEASLNGFIPMKDMETGEKILINRVTVMEMIPIERV